MKKDKSQTLVLNDAGSENHHTQPIRIETNSFSDKGKGLIMFGKSGLVITNDEEQHNGTRYDIASMNISEYGGKLTANHSQKIEDIIGRVIGTRKVANKRVVIDGIQFAIEENATALYAYNMLKAGYLTDFSIETVGPWPNDEGVYEESSLVGLSAVVVGNNKAAKINEIAINSIKEAKAMGLDASIVENNFVCYDDIEHEKTQTNNNNKENEEMKFKLIKNSRSFAVTLKYVNEAGDEVKVVVPPGQSVQVPVEGNDEVETQVTDAKEPVTPEAPKAEAENAVLAKLEAIEANQAKLEKQIFDNGASEPGFKPGASKASNSSLSTMGHMERHAHQINAFMAMHRGDATASKELNEINNLHLEALKKAGMVSNAVTLGDFGNFVISPELITEIQGRRSNFRALLDRVSFRETLSLQMAWLNRSGDINMQPVEFCDDGADGNLKPISEYSASIETADLEELAAVTPVCNAATRFLAADLLADVAAGYRTDYDRKLAQLVIARLQQAVNETGRITTYNRTSATTSLQSFATVWGGVQEEVENGVWIMNRRSAGQIISDAIAAGISGPLALTLQSGNLSPLLGDSYVIVPNELMPTLNTAETKTFVVDGANVTINQGAFYADLSAFTGRTSGGLQYDLSADAAYEDGEVVKSAFQRNEIVLRGSFFRGGAIMDTTQVAGLRAPGVS